MAVRAIFGTLPKFGLATLRLLRIIRISRVSYASPAAITSRFNDPLRCRAFYCPCYLSLESTAWLFHANLSVRLPWHRARAKASGWHDARMGPRRPRWISRDRGGVKVCEGQRRCLDRWTGLHPARQLQPRVWQCLWPHACNRNKCLRLAFVESTIKSPLAWIFLLEAGEEAVDATYLPSCTTTADSR